MDAISLSLFIISGFSLLLPLSVLLRKRTPATYAFSLLSLCNTLWIMGIAQFRIEASPLWARFWANFIYLPGGVGVMSLYYFSEIFPRRGENLSLAKKLLAFGSFSFLPYTLFFTSLFIKSVDTSVRYNLVRLGPAYVVWMVYLTALIFAAVYNLIKKQTQVTGIEKTQIRLILFSFIIPAAFNFPFNVVLPYLGNYNLIWIGPISYLALIAVMFYAIIKHRLLDVRLAVRSALVRLILVLVLAGFFVGLTAILRLIFGEMNWEKGVITAFIFGLLAAAFYEPILKSIRAITDKILFQREYSHQELLKNLGKMMAESLDLEELLDGIKETLLKVMRVSYVGFVLLGNEENGDPEIEARGFENLKDYSWSKDNLLLEQLRVNPQVLVCDELRREISEKPEGLLRQRLAHVVEEMEKIGTAVVVPLPSSQGIIGMIVLGEKKGGDAFTSSDIATLETLMYQAGIAIENASLYTKVQNFNRTLRQEIAAATADLSAKNKRLLVLRRLDEIIINTLDLSEMAQKIVDTISWELGHLGGILFLLDDEERLHAKVVSQTPAIKRAIKSLSHPLSKISFELNLDPSNLLARAIKERKPFASDDLADFFVPGVSQKVAQEFQKRANFAHLVAFSLSSKGKPLGALIFALPTPYEKLSMEEEVLLEAFVDQAGIALENALLLYQIKTAHEELQKSYARLRELDKMKDELVSISSHELRTPMTSVKSYLWMALNKANNLTPKLKKYLERAYVSSDRMIRLVEDMLSVSRIDAGRVQLTVKPIDLANLSFQVVSELAVRAEEKQINLSLKKPSKSLPKVLADNDKIREVLTNLLDNALKFTPKKGKIIVSLRRRGKMVETSVADTGPGISKEDLPKLFQKFGRLEHSFATMAESGGGTGLGLYIAKKIINLHSGKIWVQSQKGKGSTFTFSLRVAK